MTISIELESVAVSLFWMTIPGLSNDPPPRVADQEQSGHPFVAAWERKIVGGQQAGKLLVEELHCLGCHTNDTHHLIPYSKKTPDLVRSATHLDPNYLREFISNPGEILKGSTMPDLFTGNEDEAKSVEAMRLWTTCQK